MKNNLRHLMAYLRSNDYSAEQSSPAVRPPEPVITISRQRGAEGTLIAEETAKILHALNRGPQPWVVIDKNLVQHVMEDHHLSQQISDFLTDEQTATISDYLEDLLGLHPSHWTVTEKMAQTIMRLAKIGRVIFVGRAANLITSKLAQAYHVHIIGSVECRVRRVMESENLSREDAQATVQKCDFNRADFVSSYFHAAVDDPILYQLTINTDHVSVEKAGLLIAQLVSASDLRVTQKKEQSERLPNALV